MDIDSLQRKGANLRLYDPIAINNAKKWLKNKSRIRFCLSEYQAAQNADAIILVTEWKQFRFVNLKTVLAKMRGNAFFDGRNQYQAKEMAYKGFQYFGVGIPPLPTPLLSELLTLRKKKALSYADPRFDPNQPLFD